MPLSLRAPPVLALRFAPAPAPSSLQGLADSPANASFFGDAARHSGGGALSPPPAGSGGTPWRYVPPGNGSASGGSERGGRRAGAGVRRAAARRRRHAAAGGAAGRRDLRLHRPPLRFVCLQRTHLCLTCLPFRCPSLSAISSSSCRS